MILGIDYGQSLVGVAISAGNQAEAFTTIASGEALTRIEIICQKEQVTKIIIGLPEGRLKSDVINFGKQLEKKLGVPIIYQDETLTSQNASNILKQTSIRRKKRQIHEHALAARFILQSYLDEQKHL